MCSIGLHMTSGSESADLGSVHCWKWQIGHCCLNDPKKQIIILLTIFQTSNNVTTVLIIQTCSGNFQDFVSSQITLVKISHYQRKMTLHCTNASVTKDCIYICFILTQVEWSRSIQFFKAVPISLMNLLPAGLLLYYWVPSCFCPQLDSREAPAEIWLQGRAGSNITAPPPPPPLHLLPQTTWNCSSPTFLWCSARWTPMGQMWGSTAACCTEKSGLAI